VIENWLKEPVASIVANYGRYFNAPSSTKKHRKGARAQQTVALFPSFAQTFGFLFIRIRGRTRMDGIIVAYNNLTSKEIKHGMGIGRVLQKKVSRKNKKRNQG
ncbi:MAG: hypothetical protein KBS81_02060, partial [Spirochaetales bacterium]|nr:hypothetical protein [Candidatus Physcosoma equi]